MEEYLRAAQNGQGHASTGTYTPENLAEKWGLKPQRSSGKTEWHGPNPSGFGAQRDGFILKADGSSFERNGKSYTSRQTAELFGIEPAQYAPVAEWQAQNHKPHSKTRQDRRGSGQGKPSKAHSEPTARPTAPFDWDTAKLYTYRDAHGISVLEVGRCDAPGCDKSFKQRWPLEAGGYTYRKPAGFEAPLWRLHDVLAAEKPIVCEGESTAEALNEALYAAGLYGPVVATTAPGGAGKWKPEHSKALAGKAVGVLADNDAAGAAHAEQVCRETKPYAASLKRGELPGLPDKGDAKDFLRDGGTLAQVLTAIKSAPEWEPQAELEAEPQAEPPKLGLSPKSSLISAAALMALELPEPKWVIEGLICEGLTVLAGNPKLGKSWLGLGVAVAVASGGVALGNMSVEQGDVLYLALEDNRRRLQSRLGQILRSEPAPERLIIQIESPRAHEGGLEQIEAWLVAHPQARLVIIDTFQRFRSPGRNGNAYAEDYNEAAGLKALADRYSVAIVVVHHRRKGDDADDLEAVSGSYGLTGAADAVLSLKRERGRADAILTATGRDISEQALALKFEPEFGQWSALGEAAEFQGSEQRTQVLTALKDAGRAITPTEAWSLYGISTSANSAKKLLWTMERAGQLRAEGGKYSLPISGNPGNPEPI